MGPTKTIALVVAIGVLFTVGDISARSWGINRTFPYFMGMVFAATTGYALFGILTTDAEFSKATIWVSIALTTFSCFYGVLFLGDPMTRYKSLALVLALTAAFFSAK